MEHHVPIAMDIADWRLTVAHGTSLLGLFGSHAWVDHVVDVTEPDDDAELVAVVARPGETWPSLCVRVRYGPANAGFSPGILVVPETGRVFIGAGSTIVCHRTQDGRWERQWLDRADVGFWGWRPFDDLVVMAAESELAVWTIDGTKCWSVFVEPPWDHDVADGTVRLDVMGTVSTFPLRSGPRYARRL